MGATNMNQTLGPDETCTLMPISKAQEAVTGGQAHDIDLLAM